VDQKDYGLKEGLVKGAKTFVWLLKILLPISLGVTLLEWSGWLNQAEFILKPLMSLLSLPSQAALPLVIGIAAGPASGLAAMVVLPLTKAQMTLLAIFILICHGLTMEAVVQVKAGYNPVKAVVFRLAAGVVTVMVVAPFVGGGEGAAVALQAADQASLAAGEMFLGWLADIGSLLAKLLVLIMVFMVILEMVRARGWIDPLVRVLSPVLRTLGLSPRVGVLWVTAAVFGLAFGAALLVEEANSGRVDPEELEALHLSIGINHGLFDDPALFLALGLNPFWIYVPRLLAAMAAVRLLTWWRVWRRRLGAAG